MTNLTQHFKETWEELAAQLKLSELGEEDTLTKWWETVKALPPRYDILAETAEIFPRSPLLSLLNLWAYAVAETVQAMVDESLIPQNEMERLPAWLDTAVLEDLAARYADKH